MYTHYTTHKALKEEFLEDENERNRLVGIYHDTKYIVNGKEYKDSAVANKRIYKAKKRLGNDESKFNKLFSKEAPLFRYTLNFKSVDPVRGLLENMYDKRKYDAVIRILDSAIQGSYIANLEYAIDTGLHAYILCEKQQGTKEKHLTCEKPVNKEDKTVIVRYMSKEFPSTPKQKSLENDVKYYACAGKVIDNRRKKKMKRRQIIYRLNRTSQKTRKCLFSD